MFGLIIQKTAARYSLDDKKVEDLLLAILEETTNAESGGFEGFIERFRDAGISDLLAAWITGGDTARISDSEVQSVFGTDALLRISDRARISFEAAVSLTGFMLPGIIDRLSQNGRIPENEVVLAALDDFLPNRNSPQTYLKSEPTIPGNPKRGMTAFRGRSGFATISWLVPIIIVGIILLFGFLFLGNR